LLAEALEHLVRGIVDSPEDVKVSSKNNRRGDTLEVRVHQDDLGRVIGRQGRTARALRTVVAALADGEPVRVDVVDTDRRRSALGSTSFFAPALPPVKVEGPECFHPNTVAHPTTEQRNTCSFRWHESANRTESAGK
jgi:predicted RNA-binding protein YlqC (UPF0109 family)